MTSSLQTPPFTVLLQRAVAPFSLRSNTWGASMALVEVTA